MFKILAIETATTACSAALISAGAIYKKQQIAPQKHAELILPMVEDLLNAAHLSLSQLDAIAFGCGPGSFMGVRIATAVAQGLAFGADLPVIPIPTLQILAQTAYEKAGVTKAVTAWDARMNEIYWGIYQLNPEQLMEPIQNDQLSLPAQVQFPRDPEFAAVGNAWQVYETQLEKILPAETKQFGNFFPDAEYMLKIATHLYQQGKTIDPLKARPIYLRDKVTN